MASAAEIELPHESWYAAHLMGQRVGYQHNTVSPVPDGDLLRSVVAQSITVGRMGTPITIYARIEFVEDQVGRVVRMAGMNRVSRLENVVTGEVRDGTLHLQIRSPNFTSRRQIEWDDEVLGPVAQARLIRAFLEEEQAADAILSCKTFLPDPQFCKVTTVTIERVGEEQIEIGGQAKKAKKALVKQDILPGIVSTVWFDENGEELKIQVPIMGMMFERVTRDEALRDLPALGVDLLSDLLIRSNVRFVHPRQVTEVLYRLSSRGDRLKSLELDGPRQTTEKREQTAIWLRVRARPGVSAAVPDDRDLKEYLEPNHNIQCADPKILATARGVAGDAPDQWQTAKRLERWVADHVRRTFSVGSATAKEVMDNLEGDCSEHAVLLAALLRAAGIPTRIALGAVYWEGVFGYHMWTEACVATGARKRRWRSLDATLCGPFVDATHIKIGDASLATGSMVAPLMKLAQVIGELRVEILEYVEQDKRVVVGSHEGTAGPQKGPAADQPRK